MAEQRDRTKNAPRKAAKRAAASAGKNWEELSPEEKKALVRAARGRTTNEGQGQAPKEGQRQAVRALAKENAQKAGLKWKQLPKEQRQSFLKAVREAKQP